MKKVIWKYVITRQTEFTIDIPEGGFECLSVQMQNNEPCMWLIVDPTQRKVPHKFLLMSTGQEFDRDDPSLMSYLGTFQPVNGLVFHLFEVL